MPCKKEPYSLSFLLRSGQLTQNCERDFFVKNDHLSNIAAGAAGVGQGLVILGGVRDGHHLVTLTIFHLLGCRFPCHLWGGVAIARALDLLSCVVRCTLRLDLDFVDSVCGQEQCSNKDTVSVALETLAQV